MKNPESSLPPGFRFHPTDEELILHYLTKKVASAPLPVSIIADVDIYKFDPWELPAKAVLGEKEWYFFSPRDRKYPNGVRPNRAAASGYWKATGTDKTIVARSGGRQNVGVKKALVFYKGRPPKGIKTNWIMHEYRLPENPNNYTTNKSMKLKDLSMRLDDWVLCRIYKKSNVTSSVAALPSDQDQELEVEEEDFLHDILLPSLKSPLVPRGHNTMSTSTSDLKPQKSSSFSNLLEAMDYSLLTSLLADGQYSNPNGTGSGCFQSTPNNKFSCTGSGPGSGTGTGTGAVTGTGTGTGTGSTSLGQQALFNISSSSNSSYHHYSLPQFTGLNFPSAPITENWLKRQHSVTDDDHGLPSPSKKSFSARQSADGVSQTNFLNHSLLNHPLVLTSPHFQFQE